MSMNVGSSTSEEPEVLMDINTTPLIDVMLVLLVMLIITIPIQLHSVNLEMPVGTPPVNNIKPEKIQIDIDERSVVYWQGLPVNASELEAKMKALAQVQVLELEHVEILTARAEDVGQNPAHREKYDWAVARAVAAMPVLAEYLLPLVKVGGGILAQKGESGPAEAQSAEKAFKMLGGRLRQLVKVELPGVADERYLVIVDKVAATPPGYPRRAGVPGQKPL